MLPAQRNFIDAMAKLYKEGNYTDAVLVCQGTRKHVHTAVLVARSPFFEAIVKRWGLGGEKGGEIVVEECDREVLDKVVDYMYGINIPDLNKFINVLEISERFLMADLKAEIENLAIRAINRSNIKEMCDIGDQFRCCNLLKACASFMVKESIILDEEEVKKMPAATAALLQASKDARKNLEEKLEKQEKEMVELNRKVKRLQRCERVSQSLNFSLFGGSQSEENWSN